MKKRVFAIIMSLAMCLTLTLTACDKVGVKSVEKDPTGQVMLSSSDTAKSAAKTLSPFSALSKALEKGRFTVNVSDSEIGELFSGDFYIDGQNVISASYLKLGLGESGTVDLTLYEDKEEMIVGSDSILGGNYSFNFQTLRSDLEPSGIWEMIGLNSSDFMDTWGEFADAVSELFKDTDAAKKSLEDLGDNIINKVKNILNETSPAVKKENIDISGESVSAITVTYNITEKTVSDILTAVCDCYEDFLSADGYGKYFRAYLSAVLSASESDVTIDSVISEMRQGISEAFEDTAFSGAVSFALNPKTADVMNISLNGTGTDEFDTQTEIKANIMLGKNPEKSEEYVIDLSQTSDGETKASVIKLKRTDSKNGEFSRIITVNNNDAQTGDSAQEYGFILNRGDNTYKLYSSDGTSESEIGGTMTYSETEIDISVDSLKKDGEAVELPVIKIEVRAGEDVPAKPESVNFLTLDAEGLQTLISNVYMNAAPYITGLFPQNDYTGEEYGDYDFFDSYTQEDEEYQAINNFSETYDYDGDGDCGDEDDYNTWEILNSYLV